MPTIIRFVDEPQEEEIYFIHDFNVSKLDKQYCGREEYYHKVYKIYSTCDEISYEDFDEYSRLGTYSEIEIGFNDNG